MNVLEAHVAETTYGWWKADVLHLSSFTCSVHHTALMYVFSYCDSSHIQVDLKTTKTQIKDASFSIFDQKLLL